jgi:uncharacterized protein YbjT (DUF2867 family)
MLAAMTILITGGTGVLGRVVGRQLRHAGRPMRVLSRRTRSSAADVSSAADGGAGVEWAVADLATGTGLDAAMDGVTTVIHCASDGRHPGADVSAAAHLVNAARTGRPHLVYISIVGVDRLPLRYYRDKLAVEQLVQRSGLPWTVLRTTQFHDLVYGLAARLARLPVLVVPAGTSFQPIDVPEVAAHLIRLASGLPGGRVPDLGGPQIRGAADLVRTYLRARGRRRPVLPVRLPGGFARGLRDGHNLAPGQLSGGRTWDEFLADPVD